jgi:outer membrane protein assembly factor BamB
VRIGTLILLLILATAASPSAQESRAHYWPHWRGPLDTGEAPHGDPPITWSETENVRWKVELPGIGHSTPVIWGDTLFVTTAVAIGERLEPEPESAPGAHDNALVTHVHRLEVLAVSCSTGEILWESPVGELLPHEGGHVTSSFASPSPVTDGEVVIASFGSHGIFALALNGAVLWKRNLGDMQTKHGHGEGASPVLHGDTVVVNWDHEGQSFIVALNRDTGKERWRKPRDEVTSWSTPIVVEVQGKPQVVVPGTDRVRGYDLSTGDVIWECAGMSHNIVASPVAADGVVYVGSSYERQVLLAIRYADARGDVTEKENLLWVRRKMTPYVPSPLLYGDALWFLHHYQGFMTRVIAATGEEPQRPFRLTALRSVYASPVGAAGRVYLTDLEGSTMVFSAEEKPQVLAVNRLDESFSASAAIVGDALYLRGERFLYCLATE